MKNKEKASAMVLAVLILAFFMTLSLNMYFLAEKKAQRAGLKSKGTTILSDIDASSTLGYYELYLASEYLTKGLVTTSDSSIYSKSTPAFGTTVAGIKIEGYTEYFTKWVNGHIDDDGDGTADTTGNAILTTESAIGTGNGRVWNVLDDNYTELWESNNMKSIGGYELTILAGSTVLPTDTADFINKIFTSSPVSGDTENIEAIYEKEITFSGNGASFPSITFKIKVTRNSTIKYITATEYDLVSDKLESIEVIKQN